MREQKWMAQHYFIFFLSWGIFLPYWTGYLVHEKDVAIELASMMMSAGLILRGISTMFIFPAMAKRFSQSTVLTIFIYGSFLTSVLFIFTSDTTLLFILTCLLSFFLPAIMPGLDSTAGILVQKYNIHYGRSRSYGSLGFIVSVIIVSLVSALYGDQSMLWLMIAYTLLLVAVNLQRVPEALKEKPNKKGNNVSFKAIFKTRHFVFILILVTLIQGSHAAYYNYGYLYLEHLEVPKYLIGIVINVGVGFEIFLFAIADRVFSKWSPAKLLVLASIGASLRWLLAFAVPNAWIFTASQSLHALSFAVSHFAFIMYLAKELEYTQITKAQGIYSAFALSWGTAILTVISGYFYNTQPNFAFAAMFVFTLPALVGSLYLYKKTKATENM